MILLNPGPVNLSDGVRAALAGPDLCHREPEFYDLQDAIRRGILDVYGLLPTQWAAVLVAGSGTSAVEAMIATLVPQNGAVLIVENGVYGERMTRMVNVHGITSQRVTFPWGAAIDANAVARAMDERRDGVTHVAVVHHETTTGRLNQLAQLADVCRERGAKLLLDGVSSFGAEAIDFGHEALVACAGTANKCLHGAPGVSFVVARRDALFAPDLAPRTLYLDLANACREQDQRSTAFTMPVHVFHALAQALSEFHEQGGLEARHERYADLAHTVRSGLERLHIEPLLPAHESSVVLNAYRVPAGIEYEKLHDALKARGFVIYAGQGRYKDNLFRISTMGKIATSDIERLLAAFREIVRS